MTDTRQEELQGELFPSLSEDAKPIDRIGAAHRAQKPILLSTSLEQILLMVILLILSYCAVFFLGVLRGKSIVQLEPRARVIARPTVAMPAAEAPRVTLSAPIPTRIPQTTQTPVTATPQVTILATPAINPAKPYTVQLVTYKNSDLTKSEISYWKKRGYNAFASLSGNYYVVYAGQYANKEEAKADLAVYKKKYKDAYLRRR